jgi:bifunctional non-homologous end joining protein LigD
LIQLAERLPENAESINIAKKRHLEGVILKRHGSPYVGRRSLDWLKLKVNKSQEVTILGYTPQSKGKDQIGALLIGVWNGNGFDFAGKVGTGFTSRLRTELRNLLDARRQETPSAANAPRLKDAVWVKPELVAQVSFTEWTGDGRFKAYASIRNRKKQFAKTSARGRHTPSAMVPSG